MRKIAAVLSLMGLGLAGGCAHDAHMAARHEFRASRAAVHGDYDRADAEQRRADDAANRAANDITPPTPPAPPSTPLPPPVF